MTKAEIRKARQAAREAGKPLSGELALPNAPVVPVRVRRVRRVRDPMDRWSRAFYESSGPMEPDDY